MAKKKKIDIKQVIAGALEHYHKMKPSIKDSTKRQNESLLSEFYRFVDTLPARDRTMKIFSQKGLNRYKEYLIDKMERSKTDGKKRNFGVGQLNRCGSMIARLINNVLKPEEVVPNHVDWMKVEDTRREDEYGHIPLLEDEIAALEQCTGLNDKENEYRNIFLLQVECGQRVSDMGKLLIGDYKIEHGKKYNYIVLSTTKENIKAYIPLTSKIKKQLKIIESHKIITSKYFNDNIKENNTYNEAIRRIAKKVKLDRIIVKTDSVGNVQERPLYETITSHDARCTFITNMLMSGVSYEILCKMTGHASDEMIKRVYAQLTEHQEIKRIESDLYSDIDENEVCEVPEKKHQHNSLIHKESHPAIISLHENPESTSLFDKDGFRSYYHYIKNLSRYVDSTIDKICSLSPPSDDVDDHKEMQDSLRKYLDKRRSELGNEASAIVLWQELETNVVEDYRNDPEFSETVLGVIKLECLSAIIDYCKENGIEEKTIDMFEVSFQNTCEENPNADFLYRQASLSPIIMPISRFIMVLHSTLAFMQINSPIANISTIEQDSSPFRFITDWGIVFRELQKIPSVKLETLIENTHCRYEIKTALFNYIKNGDYDRFINTVIPIADEVKILIRHAYFNRYLMNIVQSFEYITKIDGANELEEVFELFDFYRESVSLQNPFVEVEDDLPRMDIKESGLKEVGLWALNSSLELIGNIMEFAYPSEIKILNKVLSLVDPNKHPELIAAYEEYKAQQIAQIEPQKSLEALVLNSDNNQKSKSTSNSIKISSKRFDIDKLVELLTKEDDLNDNKVFVTLVETDLAGIDVIDSLKYFFGVPLGYRSYTLKWNGRNRVTLKFLIRLLGTMRDELTEENVIDTYKYDGISDLVETGKEPNWGPVAKVFNYKSIDSLQSADIGVEDDVKQRNLEEMRTIAKIVFACKK